MNMSFFSESTQTRNFFVRSPTFFIVFLDLIVLTEIHSDFTSQGLPFSKQLLTFDMGLIKYFFCVNNRGSPVAMRGFLAEPTQSIIELFYNKVLERPPPDPVFRLNNMNFAYVEHAQLYFVLVTEESMAPSVLLELLGRLTSVIADYAGRCTEMIMQDNLGLIYEIVDEVMSFGCPQATDSSNLLHLVHNTVNVKTSILDDIDFLDVFTKTDYDRPLAVTAQERAKSANELYFILRENLEMTVDSENRPMRVLVTGQGICKSYLQGQPSVLVQLDPQMWFASRGHQNSLALAYDDIVFAPFVQTHSFDSDRSMTFAPPDGVTTVFSYRTSRQCPPPFRITPVFENKQAKVVVVRVSIQSCYAAEAFANDVEVRFQCPVEISNATCELPSSVADTQSSEFDNKARQVIWRIRKFKGLNEFSARFRFHFDNGIPCAAETLLGPIALRFQLIDHSVTSASIKNLIVSATGSGSQPKRWTKGETMAVSYTYNFV